MSFKFRRDGAVFPTKVENGELHINMGPLTIKVPFKFLNGITTDWDNTDYPMCNIMCYIKHADGTVIMRFDETVTKFTEDNFVCGISKFDKQDIYSQTLYLPFGTVGESGKDGIVKHMPCSIYTIPESGYYILDCIGDPEPIVFKPEDNPMFAEDIFMGNRYYPRLVKVSTNVYAEDTGRYTVSGNAIKITNYKEL